ncbi:MAG: ABC transporter ATP-binding protein [Planctomycetes bacterium]|nr:ABC transporter ATP-binding protein [Planctomycetota bacterium]
MIPVIHVEHLTKRYSGRGPARRLLRELLRPGGAPDAGACALRDVSFAVAPGTTLGIVGANGAGKSTLLALLAGVLEPSAGRIRVQGRVGSLLELGTGFHPEFTGIDNVRLQGRLQGLSARAVEERLPEILAFAEIGAYAGQPVRTYSTGMFVRLAFAAAVHWDPDVLIVDEALSVGDVFFQHRCTSRLEQLRADGRTLVLVSHDPQAIRHLCDRALYLRNGELVAEGAPAEVVARYLQERAGDAPARALPGTVPLARLPQGAERHGSGEARVAGILVLDGAGRPVDHVDGGEALCVRIVVEALQRVERCNVGFLFRDRKGLDWLGTNLALEGHAPPPLAPGETLVVEFRARLPELASGSYSLSPAVADGDAVHYRMLDWVDHAAVVQVRATRRVVGHLRVPVEVSFHVPIQR